ncbi:hypothetical protein JHK87_049915 [Glycine soja]|nr:hypothetical protein JHK87_049915 [Glycine soja]
MAEVAAESATEVGMVRELVVWVWSMEIAEGSGGRVAEAVGGEERLWKVEAPYDEWQPWKLYLVVAEMKEGFSRDRTSSTNVGGYSQNQSQGIELDVQREKGCATTKVCGNGGDSRVMYGVGEEDSPLSIDKNGLSIIEDRSTSHMRTQNKKGKEEKQFGNEV